MAPSPPRSLPTPTSLPPCFLSIPGATENTVSSYATKFLSWEEIPIHATTSSPWASRNQSRFHPVFYLLAHPRTKEMYRRCASCSSIPLISAQHLCSPPAPLVRLSRTWWVSIQASFPPPLTFLQTSSLWILDARYIHIESQPKSDGSTDVVITSTDGTMSITLEPKCTYTLLYPQAK